MNKNTIKTPIDASDQLVLLASKLILSESELQLMNNLLCQIEDVDALTVQIIKRGVAGLFLKKLPLLSNKSAINEQSLLLIEQAYLRTINRSVLLFGHFSKISQRFRNENIDIVALKGVYLAENLYKEIGLRQFSDIDLLIRENDSEKAVEILKILGYRYTETIPVSDFIRSKSDFVHLPPMYNNGISVELHIKLHKGSEKYGVNIEKAFATAVHANVNTENVLALNNFHQIIHIALHTHKHFEEGNVNFTSFSDLVNLLLTLAPEFDWQAFEKQCDEYNATGIVFRYLLLVSEFYNLSVMPDFYSNKYKSELTDSIRKCFVRFLKGYKYIEQAKTAIPGHINNLRLIKSPVDFAQYIFDLLFPPKNFMIDKYAIKNQKLYLLYYPYRYLTVFSGLWHIIHKKLKTNS